MATKAESGVVFVAATVQGIALVTFPAASTVFTERSGYDLSSTQYGTMFVPQFVTAIAASLLGAGLSQRLGTKRVYLAGLVANITSMVVLVISQSFEGSPVAYGLLLLATACLGVGFGLTVPALNTLTAAFHPGRVDASILSLNALLGLGTALAPVFVAIFIGLGFWWGLPLVSAILLSGLLLVSLRLPLRTETGARRTDRRPRFPSRFWIFAAFALLYGICETMNGNWAQLDMTGEVGASTTMASLALTAFWAMVTVGRVVFAAIQRWMPTRRTYHVLPFLLAVAFVAISELPNGSPGLGVLAFGLAGLGCSALLPLTISFGQEEMTAITASVAGGVIAAYQLGYGIAAFGAGPLQDAGWSLPEIYRWTAVIAVLMGGLSFVVTHPARQPAPAPARQTT